MNRKNFCLEKGIPPTFQYFFMVLFGYFILNCTQLLAGNVSEAGLTIFKMKMNCPWGVLTKLINVHLITCTF